MVKRQSDIGQSKHNGQEADKIMPFLQAWHKLMFQGVILLCHAICIYLCMMLFAG